MCEASQKRKVVAETLGVFGISYRSPRFHELTGLRFPEAERAKLLDQVQQELELDELIYLCTCNRVEFVYSAKQPLKGAGDARIQRLVELLELPEGGIEALHFQEGEAAARYVFEVASALDSMVIGEAQILGQFKRAFQESREQGRVGMRLNALAEAALRVAKEIRNETGLATKKLSLVSLVADEIETCLSKLEGATVALLGAGEMVAKVAQSLHGFRQQARLLFVNRTLAKAQALAHEHGGEAMSVEQFLSRSPKLDLLITATSAGNPILHRQHIQPLLSQRGLLIIDLAVPGDVARDAAGLPEVELIGIEDLRQRAASNREARHAELERARPRIEEAVSKLRPVERERLLAEVATRSISLMQERVTPLEQGANWHDLLLQRAKKVIMSNLRQCERDEVLSGLFCLPIEERAPSEDLLRGLACPAALDKKSYRGLDLEQRRELDEWYTYNARKIASLASGLFEARCAQCLS